RAAESLACDLLPYALWHGGPRAVDARARCARLPTTGIPAERTPYYEAQLEVDIRVNLCFASRLYRSVVTESIMTRPRSDATRVVAVSTRRCTRSTRNRGARARPAPTRPSHRARSRCPSGSHRRARGRAR